MAAAAVWAAAVVCVSWSGCGGCPCTSAHMCLVAGGRWRRQAAQAATAFDPATLRLVRKAPAFVAELEAAFDCFLEAPSSRRLALRPVRTVTLLLIRVHSSFRVRRC